MTKNTHPSLGTAPDYEPTGTETTVYLAAGCFWGVERIFWQTPGIVSTAVGYMGGDHPTPNYALVCMGTTGHAETVRVVYDRAVISDRQLFAIFWENHDPTQRNRQGNDVGTQYRSAIWTTDDAQLDAAREVKRAYQAELTKAGYDEITTTIEPVGDRVFHLAEDYHQAYLWKNPLGYCNHGFNGVACPTGLVH